MPAERKPARSSSRTAPTAGQRTRRASVDVTVDAKEAVDLATHTYDENVFLFVPNIIGYTRIILAGFALNYMPHHPKACTILYAISCLLDAVDGQAARALGQTSKFGAVLDMVTDRCTTSCLLCFLSSSYPKFALVFQFLISLDFSSHYMHMYSSLVTGSRSHKTVTSDVSRILWYYYNDSRTLFLFCFGNELFFVALYLMCFDKSTIGGPFPALGANLLSVYASVKPLLPPTISHFIAQYVACVASAVSSMSYSQLLALISFPICAAKNVINVVQLWKASKILVGVDLAERALERSVVQMREE